MASTNIGNTSYREKALIDKERMRSLKKSPDCNKLYGYEDLHWRKTVYCKSKVIRDERVKAKRLKYPDYVFKNINPK